MKMRIKDGLPVEETAIVSEEDKAEAEGLIESDGERDCDDA